MNHPKDHDHWWQNRLQTEPPLQYPAAMVNITNFCNLSCKHCFVFQNGNPNEKEDQKQEDALLQQLEKIRDRHGIYGIVWMGGEPMIRWKLLEKGVKLFYKNVITTNGTIPLKDFGKNVQYVISLDGPEDINDEVRGQGVYQKVMQNIASLPKDFSCILQIQCVAHKKNMHRIEEFVDTLRSTRINGVSFSFYSPALNEHNEYAWDSVEEREPVLDIILNIKKKYPGYIWNSTRAINLMRPATSKLVTNNCPAVQTVLPLYLENDHFVTPYCCMGNNADCDRCATWVVFAHAARMSGVWDTILPPSKEHESFEAGYRIGS